MPEETNGWLLSGFILYPKGTARSARLNVFSQYSRLQQSHPHIVHRFATKQEEEQYKVYMELSDTDLLDALQGTPRCRYEKLLLLRQASAGPAPGQQSSADMNEAVEQRQHWSAPQLQV